MLPAAGVKAEERPWHQDGRSAVPLRVLRAALTAPTRLCNHVLGLLCALWSGGSRPEGGWYLFLLLLNI